MLGWISFVSATVGFAALFLLRVGFLDTRSIPQHALAVIVLLLATAQLRRGGARHAKIAAVASIVVAVGFVTLLHLATRYPDDRPTGPEPGKRFPVTELRDADSGDTFALDGLEAGAGTIVLCFRGFW